jgi:serine/threonine-protein kinase RsbW
MTAEAPLQPTDGIVVQLDNSLAAVEDGRLALLDYLAPFRLDDRVINRLEVVLEELLSNVVRHNAGASKLTVQAEYQDGAIKLAIEDDGVAFDPFEVTTPAPFTTLEEAKLGGLGIPLIRRLTESLRYDRVGSANRISAVIGAR